MSLVYPFMWKRRNVVFSLNYQNLYSLYRNMNFQLHFNYPQGSFSEDPNISAAMNYDIDYLADWFWNNRIINVTITKDNSTVFEKYNELSKLDIFSGNKHKFPIYIGNNMGYGDYQFNITLRVQNNLRTWITIGWYNISTHIRIYIVDAVNP